ncbi:MAG TPA: efflux RND transporter periplasmic adaptor subunit [Blastocatellia bacterium]|nr:efflux RND transporter periplasmic adaptor subunit [Blastocatellia bacterium]
MDRELNNSIRRGRRWRRILIASILVLAAAAIFIWGPRLIAPSIALARIRTARVETGPVEAVITATGNVVPEIEQTISSAVEARVLKILKRPGSTLFKGDPIMQLDLSESRLVIEKLQRQIDLKSTQRAKTELDLENTLIDLRSRREIKSLEYRSAKTGTARQRTLFQQGLLSEERLREAELDEEKKSFEVKQLEDSIRNAQQSTRTQLEGLALEVQTLEQDRHEARRQLEIATTKSDRHGVLTWVIDQEGTTVRKGEVLARIADLSSFRVQATVSDVHANRMSAGLPVKVRINETAMLTGNIARINPTVTNGLITLIVNLDEPSNSLLRSNLRVEVLIETDRKQSVLRIRRGPFANGEGLRDVFVIRDRTAVKVPVRLGLTGSEHFEVVQGLWEGDEVIISDMTDFLHLKEVRLK